MLIVFTRTLILYIIVVVVMRIMGKRQIGQLQPFELVVAIMISELAAVPMQDTGIPLLNGIIPILTLLILQILTSYITLKSIPARQIICGTPTILIENGKLQENNMSKEMYSINDLMEQLRNKNIVNISDVEFAVLETNGQLSIVQKSQKRPLNPQDFNIPTKYEGLPANLIIDGTVIKENLKKLNLSEEWLQSELKKFGIDDTGSVLFACIDTDGNLFYQQKQSNKES